MLTSLLLPLIMVEETLFGEIMKWIVMGLFILVILGVFGYTLIPLFAMDYLSYKERYGTKWLKMWFKENWEYIKEQLKNFRLRHLNPFNKEGQNTTKDKLIRIGKLLLAIALIVGVVVLLEVIVP